HILPITFIFTFIIYLSVSSTGTYLALHSFPTRRSSDLTYNGAPFPPHALLPVDIEHFNTWLTLFYETLDEYFDGRNAEKAKGQGQRMAQIFYHKIDYLRNNPDSLFHENYR